MVNMMRKAKSIFSNTFSTVGFSVTKSKVAIPIMIALMMIKTIMIIWVR